MTVYVLMQYAPYAGGTLLGVYGTRSNALWAANFVRLGPDEWVKVHDVGLDGYPSCRDSMPEDEAIRRAVG